MKRPRSRIPPDADERDVSTLDDGTLHQLAARDGRSLLKNTWKFAGKIYLIHQRGIPQKRRYKDIFEYAAKLGGLSRAKVQEALRIGGHLESTPLLMDLFLRGEVPWTRVKLICSHVTGDTDALWADRVMKLSRRDLEALIRSTSGRPAASRSGSLPLSREVRVLETGEVEGRASGESSGSDPQQTPGWSGDIPPGDPGHIPPGDPGHIPEGKGPDGSLNSVDSNLRSQVTGGPSLLPGEGASGPTLSASPKRNETSASLSPESRDPDKPATPERPPLDEANHHQPFEIEGSPIGIMLDPLNAKHFMAIAASLSRKEGRRLSSNEVLSRLMAGFDMSRPADKRFIEVVVRDEASGFAHVETCWRDMPVDGEDLAQMKRMGEPIDIKAELQEQRMQEEAEGHKPGAQSADEAVETTAADTVGKARQEKQGDCERTPASRHVPARLKRLVLARDRGLCSVGRCRKAVATIHHRDRFGVTRRHRIDDLISLCENHHHLIHHGLIENEQEPPSQWIVSLKGRDEAWTNPAVLAIDQKVQQHRQFM